MSRINNQLIQKLRIPGNLLAIAGAITLVRSAIANTADLLEIFNSISGFGSVVLIVLTFLGNVALTVYLNSAESEQISPTSSKQRLKQRRTEKKWLSIYRSITLLLFITVLTLVGSLVSTLLNWHDLTEFNRLAKSLVVQTQKKSSEQVEVYQIPFPATGATIHLYETFDNTGNELGHTEDYVQVHNSSIGRISKDDFIHNNNIYLVTGGNILPYLTVSSAGGQIGSRREIHFRIRLVNESVTRNEIDEPFIFFNKIHDGAWHTISVVFDMNDMTGTAYLDGNFAFDVPFSGNMEQDPTFYLAHPLSNLSLSAHEIKSEFIVQPGEEVIYEDPYLASQFVLDNVFFVFAFPNNSTWAFDDILYWTSP